MRLQCQRPVIVRGKTIGGTDPLVCLPLVAKNSEDLLQQAEELISLEPDILEWRVDAFDPVESIDITLQALSELRSAIGSTPLIFTCRIDREGGMQSLSKEIRLKLITAAMAAGHVDIVDTELCNDAAFIEKNITPNNLDPYTISPLCAILNVFLVFEGLYLFHLQGIIQNQLF